MNTSTTNQDPLLSLVEAAHYLDVSRDTVRRLIACEKLDGTFVGRLVRVRRSALEAYIAAATTPRQQGSR